MEQAVGEGVNALSLEGRGVSAEKGLCSPPSHTHIYTLRAAATHTSTHTTVHDSASDTSTGVSSDWSVLCSSRGLC